MPYKSIDELQNILANGIFNDRTDKKKASGRALGTFIEIITFYLLKTWGFETNIAIERRLPEYKNDKITHNVEFTLHGCKKIISKIPVESNDNLTNKFLLKEDSVHKIGWTFNKKDWEIKSNKLLDKNCIRNACTLAVDNRYILNAYYDSIHNQYSIVKLQNKPFAMFECKRVGKEEGTTKGPQTIEKAKQGAYVANTVSCLQKFRGHDGTLNGILYDPTNNTYPIDEYTILLDQIINSNDMDLLKDFILTVGIVSNHGNWFTSEDPGKKLQILSQSYDFLFFLTDQGMCEFIDNLLLNPTGNLRIIKTIFEDSYNKNSSTTTQFTKIKMNIEADRALIKYFQVNLARIESWFNPISPKGTSLNDLKDILQLLSLKNWDIR